MLSSFSPESHACNLSYVQVLCVCIYIWLDPLGLLAVSLRNYRSRTVLLRKDFFVCTCSDGIHNIFTLSGMKEILMSFILMEMKVRGITIGIMMFMISTLRIASLLLMLAADFVLASSFLSFIIGKNGVVRDEISSLLTLWSCLENIYYQPIAFTLGGIIISIPLVYQQVYQAHKYEVSLAATDLRTKDFDSDFLKVLSKLQDL
jgi:hypothetical protein